MNRHLSERQLDRWPAGERDPEQERHVRECASCQAEVARIEGAIAKFRGAVHQWSSRVEGAEGGRNWRGEHVAAEPPRGWHPGWLRPLVAAALMLVVTLTFCLHSRARERAAEAARADAVLLERIDSEISRAVPRPMEPLVQMVSWGPGTAEAGEAR